MTHYDIATLAGYLARDRKPSHLVSLRAQGIVTTSGRRIIVDLVRLSRGTRARVGRSAGLRYSL